MQIMEGARLQMLQLLQHRYGATVGELAQHVSLAPATVRRHLDILQRDRLISYTTVKKRTGRPEFAYSLTEAGQEALPKDYANLLTSLINEISNLEAQEVQNLDGQQLLETALQRASGRVAQQALHSLNGKGPQERLRRLTEILRERGFRPVVEQRQGEVYIQLLNCPFRAAALEHAGVCTFDRDLIASVLQRAVTKEQCIRDGDFVCCYRAFPNPLPSPFPISFTPSSTALPVAGRNRKAPATPGE